MRLNNKLLPCVGSLFPHPLKPGFLKTKSNTIFITANNVDDIEKVKIAGDISLYLIDTGGLNERTAIVYELINPNTVIDQIIRSFLPSEKLEIFLSPNLLPIFQKIPLQSGQLKIKEFEHYKVDLIDIKSDRIRQNKIINPFINVFKRIIFGFPVIAPTLVLYLLFLSLFSINTFFTGSALAIISYLILCCFWSIFPCCGWVKGFCTGIFSSLIFLCIMYLNFQQWVILPILGLIFIPIWIGGTLMGVKYLD